MKKIAWLTKKSLYVKSNNITSTNIFDNPLDINSCIKIQTLKQDFLPKKRSTDDF